MSKKFIIINKIRKINYKVNITNLGNSSNNYMDAIIGDMLGDGHIRCSPNNKKGRMEFTFSTDNLPYLNYLKFVIYSELCNLTKPTPWPNPKTGKLVTQYWFGTRYLLLFKELHNQWYKKINDKNVKIVPLNIKEVLKPRGLAHWIMGDGYWNGNTVYLCRDCYTEKEVILLIDTLNCNFGIISKKVKRLPKSGVICWRIRIDPKSVDKLRETVTPFMIPDILYKLNIK